MSDSEFANPGDTIISRNTPCQKGERMLVIDKPDDVPGYAVDTPGCAWVRDYRGQAVFLRPDKYVVVERAGKVNRTVDEVVKSDVDIDASLRKQRDKNLKHAFGF